ncbi:MAG: hypothetical protein JWM86_2460 [Thermoleophilia bacterium]|nr:hypothetical protein [Thermoleophilia bacterium]
MHLASVAAPSVTQPATALDAEPTYIGLRISDDREFSAPQYAAKVTALAATDAVAAADEAQVLLRAGGFDGAAARDAAKAVAILEGPDATYSAGVIVEQRFGGHLDPVSVSLTDPHFDYAYEPAVVGVATRDTVDVIERG